MTKSMWLAVLVCVSLGITYAVLRKDRIRVGVRELTLSQFDPSWIDKIEIDGSQKVQLLKESDAWQVYLGGPDHRKVPANETYVADLFESIAKIQSVNFVTERLDKQAEFHVSDDKASKIYLYSLRKPVWSLLIGDEAQGGGRYIRVPGTKAIFVAKGKFADLMRSVSEDWRDRKIIPLTNEKLTKLVFRQNAEEVVMTLEQSHWQITANSKLGMTEEKAILFADALVRLRALRFVESLQDIAWAKQNFKKFAREITVYEKNGSFYQLLISADEKKQKAWAQIKGGNQIYEISTHAFNGLDLLAKN